MEVLKFPLSSCHLFEAAAPTRAQCPGDTPLLVALGGGQEVAGASRAVEQYVGV